MKPSSSGVFLVDIDKRMRFSMRNSLSLGECEYPSFYAFLIDYSL
jgi:hypothetical protein